MRQVNANEIRLRDAVAAELLKPCLGAPGDPEPAEAFCACVLRPVGGRPGESRRLTDDPLLCY